jgi:hypothetical protein
VFQGAAWQRCRVHFMRNVLSAVPKGSQDMVASLNCCEAAPLRLRLGPGGHSRKLRWNIETIRR